MFDPWVCVFRQKEVFSCLPVRPNDTQWEGHAVMKMEQESTATMHGDQVATSAENPPTEAYITSHMKAFMAPKRDLTNIVLDGALLERRRHER